MSIIKGKKLIQYRKWNVYYAQVLARSHFGNVGNHNLANFETLRTLASFKGHNEFCDDAMIQLNFDNESEKPHTTVPR